MRLYINVDHVATVRQARRTDEPDPVAAARSCEAAGAHGITAHLREDRRHMQDDDLIRLSASVKTVLNIELALAPEIVDLVCRLKPYQATFVPERREEITTEGGLDLSRRDERLAAAIRKVQAAGVHVSLFIDPDARRRFARRPSSAFPRSSCTPGATAHTWREGGEALEHLRSRRGLRAAARARGARRPRPHLPQRGAGRGHRGDRGAQHRAQHREPGGDERDGRRRWLKWAG